MRSSQIRGPVLKALPHSSRGGVCLCVGGSIRAFIQETLEPIFSVFPSLPCFHNLQGRCQTLLLPHSVTLYHPVQDARPLLIQQLCRVIFDFNFSVTVAHVEGYGFDSLPNSVICRWNSWQAVGCQPYFPDRVVLKVIPTLEARCDAVSTSHAFQLAY